MIGGFFMMNRRLVNTLNTLAPLLVVGGGLFIWRNRFRIQQRLESMGIRTPVLTGGVEETAHSVASKVGGKMERGATIAENLLSRKVS